MFTAELFGTKLEFRLKTLLGCEIMQNSFDSKAAVEPYKPNSIDALERLGQNTGSFYAPPDVQMSACL